MTCSITPPVFSSRRYVTGFSLLELLVVIIIIGILFSFTTLAIRKTDPDELIQLEARRFNALIQLALEESIFRGQEYGVAFTPNSYSFLTFKDNTWNEIKDDKLLHSRSLPNDIEIELLVEKTSVEFKSSMGSNDKIELEPQVFLLSSGEINPEFTARFVIYGDPHAYQVNGYIDGKHEVKRYE